MTKRLAILVFSLFLSELAVGQSMNFDLPVTLERTVYGVDEGEVIIIKALEFNRIGDLNVKVEKNGKDYHLPLTILKDIKQQTPSSIYNFWQQEFLTRHAFEAYNYSSDFQFDIRRELDELSNDAVQYYEANDLLIRDLYVEAYLHELIHDLYPSEIKPGLPGNVQVRILKNTFPSAKIYPNGAIIINSGLLTLVKSEIELKAVLAHELAHYVLEHPLNRLSELKKRKARAEFWAGMATVAAAAVDVSMASRGRNYAPGMLTYSTAVISTALADQIEYQVGIKYSHEQEYEADQVAVRLLEYLGYNSDPLYTVLARLQGYYYYNGFYESIVNSETHPELSMRMNKLGGEFLQEIDINYQRTISEVISYNGNIEYYNFHYNHALSMYETNISNGLASSNDYLKAALCLIYLNNDTASNKLALTYLDSIGSSTESNLLLKDKVRGIVYYRLANKELAKESIERYIQELKSAKADDSFTLGQVEVSNWCDDEIFWSLRLLRKWELR